MIYGESEVKQVIALEKSMVRFYYIVSIVAICIGAVTILFTFISSDSIKESEVTRIGGLIITVMGLLKYSEIVKHKKKIIVFQRCQSYLKVSFETNAIPEAQRTANEELSRIIEKGIFG